MASPIRLPEDILFVTDPYFMALVPGIFPGSKDYNKVLDLT